MTVDIAQARLLKAREIAAATYASMDYDGCAKWASDGEYDHDEAVKSALAALNLADWQPPEDPDLPTLRRIIGESYGDYSSPIGDGPSRVRDIVAGEGDQYWEVHACRAAFKAGKAAR